MGDKEVNITMENPFASDAVALMEELSDCLQSITGDSGKNSFDPQDVCSERAVFVIARNEVGKAIGCGAFRPMNQTTAEVKRMYAKEQGRGVGKQILTYLEHKAYEMGYETLCLETRLVNTSAVSFYERSGYKSIPNYGKYAGRGDAVCFEKSLLM